MESQSLRIRRRIIDCNDFCKCGIDRSIRKCTVKKMESSDKKEFWRGPRKLKLTWMAKIYKSLRWDLGSCHQPHILGSQIGSTNVCSCCFTKTYSSTATWMVNLIVIAPTHHSLHSSIKSIQVIFSWRRNPLPYIIILSDNIPSNLYFFYILLVFHKLKWFRKVIRNVDQFI